MTLDDLRLNRRRPARMVADEDVEHIPVSCDCGAVWTGTKPEHCTVCHQTFGSTTAGDMHRTGAHAIWKGPKRRRCRSVEWMRGKGWRQDDAGIWRLPAPESNPFTKGADPA